MIRESVGKLYLHVLLLPSSYPTRPRPVRGFLFNNKLKHYTGQELRLGLFIHIFAVCDLGVSALPDNHFQISFDQENGIPTYRFCGWNIRA